MDQAKALADDARARLSRAERSVELTKNSFHMDASCRCTRVVTATLIEPGNRYLGQTAIRVARFGEKES